MLAETYPTSKTNSVLSSRSKSLSIVDKTVLKNAFLLFQTMLSCCKCSCHFELFSSFNTHYYMFALALKFNHFSMFSANRKKKQVSNLGLSKKIYISIPCFLYDLFCCCRVPTSRGFAQNLEFQTQQLHIEAMWRSQLESRN